MCMNGELPRYELVFNENEMEGVYGVSLVSDPAIQIEAIKFSLEKSDDIDSKIVEDLLLKGEKVDNDEWELLEVKSVDDESVYSIDLSNVVPTSDGESSQDNELFLVRYRYSPSSASAKSRDFCIRMTSTDNVYKKEDLISSNANAGFGPGGASSYNIFLYKGGVNCKHYWQREIYLRKNNQKMSVYEALKWISNLDKETFKKAKFEINPSEVSEVASSSNNFWKLSKEITDIKMTSEEKRILTSPVLIPEQNIFRNFDGEKCNVFLTAETIEKLQQNFFKNNYQKNSTIEHLNVIDGVFFFESWIVKNSDNDKAKELGFNVPIGTWMMSMKVENVEIWNEYVKTGLIKGFSIDSRLGVQKNTKNNKEKMNYSKVKEMVMKSILMEAQLNEFKIDDSLSVYAEALDKDMVVFDKDNNPLANQEFTFEGKTFKTDDNGVIVEIIEVEPAQEEPKKEEVDAAEADAPAQEEAPSDSTKLQEDLDAALKRIEELEVENQTLKAELVTVKEEAVNLSKQPKIEGINLKNTEIETISKPKSALDVIREQLKK